MFITRKLTVPGWEIALEAVAPIPASPCAASMPRTNKTWMGLAAEPPSACRDLAWTWQVSEAGLGRALTPGGRAETLVWCCLEQLLAPQTLGSYQSTPGTRSWLRKVVCSGRWPGPIPDAHLLCSSRCGERRGGGAEAAEPCRLLLLQPLLRPASPPSLGAARPELPRPASCSPPVQPPMQSEPSRRSPCLFTQMR